MSDLAQMVVPPPPSTTESNVMMTAAEADHPHLMDPLHITTTTTSASATAAPDSERTNSSSITSQSSSGNNNHENNNNNSSSNEAPPHNHNNNSNSQVSFGSVHVHEHRMTLGSNPEVTYGVPVELAWTEEESNVFDTVDDFEHRHLNNNNNNNEPDDHHNGTTTSKSPAHDASYPHTVHRIKAADRDDIASLHHSRDSIVRVKQQVQQIQEQRHVSKRDPAAMQIVQDIRREQMHRDGNTTTTTTTTTTTQPMDRTTTAAAQWCCCPFF